MTVILYDGDCGACACVVAWLVRRGAGNLGARAIQDGDDHNLGLASWHVIEPNGSTRSGAQVVLSPAVHDALPAGALLAAFVRLLPGVSEGIYRLVANTRGWWGRLFSETRKAAALAELRRPRPAA